MGFATVGAGLWKRSFKQAVEFILYIACFFASKAAGVGVVCMKVRENVFGVLFEKTPNAVSYQRVIVDEQGRPCDCEFAGVNEAFETLFHLGSAQVVGRNFSAVFEGLDRERLVQLLQETLAGGGRWQALEMACPTDAGPAWLRIMAFSLDAEHLAMLYADVTKEIAHDKEVDECRQVMAALQQANNELRMLASTDDLTGLCNRCHFEQRLLAEMERADRYGDPLSMIIFDLDYFKRINDTWGHPVGDAVLKQAAASAQKVIRTADVLGRWGGEEFAVLMPETAYAGALAAAEKLRATLAQCQHPQAGAITASFGVAERLPGESLNHWYQRCDMALYRAKNSGRNCVVGCEGGEGAALPIASVRLAWRKEWECGHRVIDMQHQELIALANNLLNIAYAGAQKTQVVAQLEGLLNHIGWHFEAEEEVLAALNYPERHEHAAKHRQLLAKALRMKTLFQQHQLQMSAFFSFVVDDIVIGHMLQDDSRFFAHTRTAAQQHS